MNTIFISKTKKIFHTFRYWVIKFSYDCRFTFWLRSQNDILRISSVLFILYTIIKYHVGIFTYTLASKFGDGSICIPSNGSKCKIFRICTAGIMFYLERKRMFHRLYNTQREYLFNRVWVGLLWTLTGVILSDRVRSLLKKMLHKILQIHSPFFILSLTMYSI